MKYLSSGNDDALEGRTEDAHAFPISALRQSSLQQQCPLKGAPKCPPASKRYRTHDGTCNNLNRPRWGSTMTPVQRFLPPSYSDGIQAPRRSVTGFQLPSAREISALVHEDQHAENTGITHLLMQWGQFLDHDITSSSQSRGFNGSVPRCCKDGGRDFVPNEFLHPECFPIPVPPTDPFYGPRGVRCLDFVRSSPAPRDDCALGWREQLNQVSAYIDASPLYASSARQSDKLRLFRNGMLQYGRVQQRRPLLPPERKDELCRGGAVSTDCFKSGDARVNEHPGLVAAHIVWLRQHNRMAQELAHLNPHWSDEKIYQETRKIVGAMIQHITYREFLPIVLGADVMRLFELEPLTKGQYRDYDPKTNPSPANVSLHDEITNPSNIWSIGAVDRLLLGMVNQPIQKRDEFITEELTNHLFQTPSFDFGMDLAAINIQRGRDHGVPPYTSWREPCGLSGIRAFQDLFRVMPARVVRKLQTLYRSVDDIDLFTGGMAERPVVGGLVGPTFACIIAQQFSNLRKGDRFWYENGGFDSSFTPAQLQQIRRISFAQVLCHTLDSIDSIQPFVFLSPDNPDNGRISCKNGLLNDFDLSPWVEIFDNDISKADNQEIPSTLKPSTRRPTRKPSTQKPKRTKPTTAKPTSTTKKQQKVTAAASNTVTKKKPAPLISTTTDKPTEKPNKTDTVVNDKTNDTLTFSFLADKTTKKPNVTVQNIDDKLDFKNKSRRFENSDSINTRDTFKGSNKQYGSDDYDDDEEDVQSNYDDTYRRPTRPHYYNNDKYDQNGQNYNPYRREQPDSDNDKIDFDKDNIQSSARSNDDTMTTPKSKPTIDKTNKIDHFNPTTENLYKLVTFGYVGTYKGDMTDKIPPELTERHSVISKDFSTYDTKQNDNENDDKSNAKLSTFFLYETATEPYNKAQRPTRRNDEDSNKGTKTKYYYIKNVLHKYSETDATGTITEKDIIKENYNSPGLPVENIEERSSADKLAFLEEAERAVSDSKQRHKIKKPSSPAKTPSVAFQVIPSENNPSQWAVYEEKDLPAVFPARQPALSSDPHALREIPRPIKLPTFRKRRPWKV
ncbi:peroxidase domain-containing protein [Phthorimaea operculella]|nr:peroxidase domain-containing protein [Phthorimaea operculella]